MDNSSFFEKTADSLISKAKKYRYPLITGFCIGLLCYVFFFTNKVLQQDELAAMFGKGTTLSAGRWGLELAGIIFPDYSMPWVYGVLSLIMLSVASCIVTDTVDMRNCYLQCIFAALFTSSPSITGIFTQPYLSAANALAILLAVIGIRCFLLNPMRQWWKGCICMVFSVSFYQAYISLAAGIAVVVLIKRLLSDRIQAKTVFRSCISTLGLLVISVAVYGAITLAVNAVFNVEVLSYGYSDYGILMRLRVAYTAFAGYFIKGYFSFVNSVPSLIMHIMCICVTAYLFIRKCIEIKDKYIIILASVLLVMLPLAINSMYLVSSVNVMSAIVFMSFNAMYLLMLVLFDGSVPAYPRLRGVLELGLTLIVVSNIYFANRISLKMYLQTEELRSYYTSLMTEVLDSGEYEPGKPLAVIGTPQGTYSLDEIDSSNFIGLTAENIYDIYTRMNYIRYYLGYDFQDISLDMQYYLSSTEKFTSMPCYPEEGCVAEIDGVTVVKLSD